MNFLIVILMLFCMTACQKYIPEKKFASNYGGTFHRKSIVLRNIALPRNLKIQDGSFWFGTNEFRYGEFYLSGEEEISKVRNFFKNQMTSGGWDEIGGKNWDSHAILKFMNPNELCTMYLKEMTSGTSVKLVIEQKKT